MKHRIPLLAIVFLLGFAAIPIEREVITIEGSDTMVMLVQGWAEAYPLKQNTEFQVTGGGSGTGIAALINGTTTICAASRTIKRTEVSQLIARTGYRGMEVRVARDGLSVYVHPSNPIHQLTIHQLRKIFTGAITNWKQVGGRDKRIILYSRENNSGTYEFFKERVLHKADFAPTAQHLPGTAALVNALSKDPNGIGYGGAAFTQGVRPLLVAVDASSPFIEPTQETIVSGSYPISRFLYFYLGARPSGRVREFINWVLSADGQRVVTALGYFPVAKSNP